jgi:hypothetical protein
MCNHAISIYYEHNELWPTRTLLTTSDNKKYTIPKEWVEEKFLFCPRCGEKL